MMTMNKELIRGKTKDELKELFPDGPSYRMDQVYEWIHKKRIHSFDGMTNIPKDLRKELEKKFVLNSLEKETVRMSKDGSRKYLYKTMDGEHIECVYIPHDYGDSICVSTQAGCRMGCSFCGTAMGGFRRSLTCAEMAEQIEGHEGEKITHAVIMGMGEPLDNYDETVKFIRLITDGEGYDMSARNITLSTCGITGRIRNLAGEGLPVTLALSLHAPTQKKRELIMPIAKRYHLREVLDACSFYFKKTGRRVTYEYAMIRGINDSREDAGKLALLLGRGQHVNLIPFNSVDGKQMDSSSEGTIRSFKNILEKNKINVTIRASAGADIDAACGQLRNKKERLLG